MPDFSMQESLSADNIYKVLGIEPATNMTKEQYLEANTFIITWAFQLEHKCQETIDWDSLTYSDVFRELVESFKDDPAQQDHFSGVALEKLMRTIDVEYNPGLTANKTAFCLDEEAWVSTHADRKIKCVNHPWHSVCTSAREVPCCLERSASP